MEITSLQSYPQVLKFFKGDTEKTKLWFEIPNPAFGDISPIDLIRMRGEGKINQFVSHAIEENKHASNKV